VRIAIVTGFFLPVPAISGGATERSWHGLAKLFAAQGHTVTFVSRRVGAATATEVLEGVSFVRVRGFDHTGSLVKNLLLDLIWGIRVARVLPKGDVVICNTLTLPVWLRLIRPSSGKVAVMIGRTPKGQVSLYRAVARIFVPSTAVAAEINSDWAIERTRVIGYPIDWNLHAGFSDLKAAPITVGFVGRLHREKGLGLLIAAAQLLSKRTDLPPWRLRIVGPHSVSEGGDGVEWLSGLKAQTESMGSRVEWRGPEFNAAALARVFGELDIFCYPSIADRGETFGVAIAEAMAARCSVVVSGLACFSDLVQEGLTGLIFDHRAREPEKILADAIGRLISDPVLRNNLAVNGQRHAKKYDYPNVSQLILTDLAVLTGPSAISPQQ
jgi:glycosyltransferase involved in cell wall biosynthesis